MNTTCDKCGNNEHERNLMPCYGSYICVPCSHQYDDEELTESLTVFSAIGTGGNCRAWVVGDDKEGGQYALLADHLDLPEYDAEEYYLGLYLGDQDHSEPQYTIVCSSYQECEKVALGWAENDLKLWKEETGLIACEYKQKPVMLSDTADSTIHNPEFTIDWGYFGETENA